MTEPTCAALKRVGGGYPVGFDDLPIIRWFRAA